MRKNTRKFFGNFCQNSRRSDARRADQLTSLRFEPLERREVLSATGLGAASGEIAYVSAIDESAPETVDLSAVPDVSSVEYAGLDMADLCVDWEFLNAVGTSVNINVFSTRQQYLRDDVVIDFENNTIQYPDGYTDYFEYEDIIVNYDELFRLRHCQTIGAIVDGGSVASVNQADYCDQDGRYHHSTAHALIRPTDYVYSETDPLLVESVSFEIPEWLDVESFSYVVVNFNAKAADAQAQGCRSDFDSIYYAINGDVDNPVPISGDDAYGRHYGQVASLVFGTNVIEFSEPVYNCFDLRLDLYFYSPALSIDGVEVAQREQLGTEGLFTTTEFTFGVGDAADVGVDFSRYEINSLTIRGALVGATEGESNAFEVVVDPSDLNAIEAEVLGLWILDASVVIPELNQGGDYEFEYVLSYGVKDQDGFYRQGEDKYVPVELSVSGSFQANVPGIVMSEAVWNLDDYPAYKSFKLEATPDENTTATLYGLEGDGTYTLLQAWNYVGTEAIVTIKGRDSKADDLWITESAAKLLAGIGFEGGKGLLDKLTLDGTDENDEVAISTETIVTETRIFTTNPYEKALENYRKIYGETSPIYQRIAANLEAAYQKLIQKVAKKATTVGVVELNGKTTKFFGVRDATINLGAGDDAVKVDALHYSYSLTSSDGANSLDFADAKGRLNLDAGATTRQSAIAGDGGTLRLDGAFTEIQGTKFNDRVVGSEDGVVFFGNGGSDSATLVGGENFVLLVGPRQSVVARGKGVYNIMIGEGDNSVVNADGVKVEGTTNVSIEGARATVYGGRGYLGGEVEGDYATVKAGSTLLTEIEIEGLHTSVTTGSGDDYVEVEGDYATVNTGAGADYVDLTGAYANVRLGAGDDICVLIDGEAEEEEEEEEEGDDESEEGDSDKDKSETGDSEEGDSEEGDSEEGDSEEGDSEEGEDEEDEDEEEEKKTVVGSNRVWGDAGNDIIFAANASGTNYFHAGAGNDVIVGGAGNDFIYGESGDNLLFGNGGADSVYGGVGRDVLIASTTTNVPDKPEVGDEDEEDDENRRQGYYEVYEEAFRAWTEDKDLDATIAALGEFCISDGAKDKIYRGGGRGNLVYLSLADKDWTNALERSPFNDVLVLDDPNAADDSEGDEGEEEDDE